MKRIVLGLSTLSCLILACALQAQEGAVAKGVVSLYPLKKDSVWTYKVDKNSIQMKVTEANKEEYKIETIINGKSVANEVVTVKEDGVYRIAINGQKPDAPVKFLHLPAKKDASWDVDTKIQGQAVKGKFVMKEEEVKVPAGTYKAFIVEGNKFDIAGMPTDIKYWFADGVGIVKLSFTIGGQDATLELEKYEAGK